MYTTITVDFEQRIKDIYGNSVPFYDCTEFFGINSFMSAKCKKCLRLHEGTARKFIRHDMPFKCGYCNGKIKNTEIIKEEIFNLVGDEYILLSEYISAHKPMTLHHKICGNSYEMSKNQFVTKNQRCTFCSASVGEQLIQNYFNKNNLHYLFDRKYQGESECLNKTGSPLRFDFQIINYLGNVCAIVEFDGNQHYQDVKYFNQTKKENQILDKIKNDFCLEQNIPLLRLPISELLRRQNTKLTSSNISIGILYSKLESFLLGLSQGLTVNTEILDIVFLENKNKIKKKSKNEKLKLLLDDDNLLWKDIPEYEGIYKISTNGSVISLNDNLEPIRALKPITSSKYGPTLKLSKDRKTTNFILARLVYMTFNNTTHDFLKDFRLVSIDGNHNNVSLENIKLLTKEEAMYEIKNKNKKSVYRIDMNTNEIKIYYPITSVRVYGFDASSVVKCCKGKAPQHKGYRWEYIEVDLELK